MLMDLREVMNSPELIVKKEFDGNINSFKTKGKSYSVGMNGPVVLEIRNVEEGRVEITGKVSISIEADCDRCLKKAIFPLDFFIKREVWSQEKATKENLEDQEDFVLEDVMDIEKLIRVEMLLMWPDKFLCKEDCKGICMVCGKDLNTEECQCDRFVPDPRWAGLNDIFKGNKEV